MKCKFANQFIHVFEILFVKALHHYTPIPFATQLHRSIILGISMWAVVL